MGGIKLSFVPSQPSSLRIISGPHSPASPLSPHHSRLHYSTRRNSCAHHMFSPSPRSQAIASCPPSPMPWMWSCHKCRTHYLLGATRRCLHDGHYFCGGTTVDRITGRVKKHKACSSEFDYIGWKGFGGWKKDGFGGCSLVGQSRGKDCEHQCHFPSECHWKAKHAVQKDFDFDFLD